MDEIEVGENITETKRYENLLRKIISETKRNWSSKPNITMEFLLKNITLFR